MVGKRIFIVIMIVILIVVPTRNCYAAAEAATITVVGGSVAAGGIGAALATVAPVALVIVGVALAAEGIYIAVSDAAEKEGKTKQEYLEEQINLYCDAAGRTVDEFCNSICDGACVLADGAIAIANSASDTISSWINYLLGNNDISEGVVSGEELYARVGNYNLPYLGKGQSCDIFIDSSGSTYSIECSQYSDNGFAVYANLSSIMLISEGNTFQYVVKKDGSGIMWSSGGHTFGNLYDQNAIAYSVGSEILVPLITDNSFLRELTDLNVGAVAQDSGFFTDDISNVDVSDFENEDGYLTVINPGLDLGDIANEYGKDGIVSVRDYLETLQRALDGVENNTLAISNALTGALDTVRVGVYNPVGEASLSQEDEERLYAGVYTPALDTSLNPSGSAAENALKGMQFDLTGIFPFCIPFDLFALIEKFDVQPETPNVHLVFPLGGLNEDLVFDMDLSPFESVAQVLRTMELIAFVVGLAMVTRNIIRG